ncbi:DUF3347 domain-containing protein [Flavobacterium microcysteis]|uniref:DUF3347 domain-containing protein n=1 Tax=Flavobacterium microcysteis TaxID=2596891 RepID=A0A501Q0I2_9FLAO|nr:DUF3347 domain-containing protein [Flavobacterium microcysteis]
MVKADGTAATSASKELSTAISSAKMKMLKTDEHMIWMKVSKDLTAEAKNISETQDIKSSKNFSIQFTRNKKACKSLLLQVFFDSNMYFAKFLK